MWPLFIPWLLAFMVIMSLAFACMRKWIFALSFLVIALVINWRCGIVVAHVFHEKREPSSFKVMSWNINGSDENIEDNLYSISNKILKENADIVFLAEDYYGICDTLDSLLRRTYPYSTHIVCNESHYFYSKFPLGDREWVAKDIDSTSVIIESSVDIGGRRIGLYGCHLSSNNRFDNMKRGIRPEKISSMSNLSLYMNNISEASAYRVKEAKVISQRIGNDIPVIIMGDMNDVTASPALEVLRDAGFTDAWQEKGFGYGATIYNPLPFRIDHIFYNSYLKLVNMDKISADGLSDHDALVADFKIR